MLYLIDTAPWTEEDVKRECIAHGVEYKGGFFFPQTCTKLGSHLIKQQIASDHDAEFKIDVSPAGKPYFVGSDIHFNVTHHNRIVLAVASRTQPVGIDLTDLKTPFNHEDLVRLFTDAPSPQLEGFYWAAREAYLKYTGEGTRDEPLDVKKPAHEAIPDLERLKSISVMPFMKVERVYARLFKVRDLVGAVIAPREDVAEVCGFSSEIE